MATEAATESKSKKDTGNHADKPLKAAPTLDVITLDRKQIKVDNKINARTSFDPTKSDQEKESADFRTLNDLAADIRENGLLEPVIVRKLGNEYHLVAGFRRMAACDLVGLTRISATVKENVSELEATKLNIVENVQRNDLQPFELAYALQKLKAQASTKGEKITNEQMADMIHCSKSHVGNLLRCAENLIPKIAKAFKGEGGIALDLAKAIKFSGMSKEEQAEAWEIFLERKLGSGTEGEEGKEGEGKDAKKRAPRKEKVEAMLDNVQRNLVTDIKISGAWTPFKEEHKKVVRAVLRWVVGETEIEPFKLEEVEEEEEDEEENE
jgi:ParB family chromosome partitioning protein